MESPRIETAIKGYISLSMYPLISQRTTDLMRTRSTKLSTAGFWATACLWKSVLLITHYDWLWSPKCYATASAQ